jgi:hypothetical protein
MHSTFRSMLVLAAAIGALVLAAPAFAAPPANDNFANAITLSGSSGSTSATTIDSTDEAGEPAGGTGGVWYSWKPSVSGSAVFDTCTAASYDTWVDVFTGDSLGALTLVSSGDDGCGFKQSVTPFRASAGTKYWVRVGGYNGQRGTFTLSWKVQPNDDFAAAQTLGGRSGSVSASAAGATEEPGEPNANGAGLWYSWTAPSDGSVTFDTCAGAQFDTVLDAFTGASLAGLVRIANSDDACGTAAPGDHGRLSSVTFATTAGTTYSIRVTAAAGTAPRAGIFTLSWSYTGPDLTPGSLCLLTAQYVQGSAKYQALRLTSLQRTQINVLVNWACQSLNSLVARMTPAQKAGFVSFYKTTVGALAAGGWLTPEQKTTLTTLAGLL